MRTRTYRVKIMIAADGKKPTCIGIPYIKATDENEALAIALQQGMKAHAHACEVTGHRDETTKIWVELYQPRPRKKKEEQI